jgi:ribosomal protein S12 methylthiotransferase accessory factor
VSGARALEKSPFHLPPWAQDIGVTRVARVTGLDRLGIEVAAAVRPQGHVLQVSQGKGATVQAAVASALAEAAELQAAEHPDFHRFVYRQLDTLHRPFIEAVDLHGVRGFIPAEAVYCPSIERGWAAPHIERWTSNGLAAHRDGALARQHAVCELIERDAVARAFPQGWTAQRMNQFELEVPPRWQWLSARDFQLRLAALPAVAPTVAALLVDERGGAVALTAGYATRLTGAAAIDAAVFEAAQSRLTDIHGAREDIMHSHGASRRFDALLRRRKRGDFRVFESVSITFRRLCRSIESQVLIAELTLAPLVVVKAWSPQLKHSELL